MGAEQVLLQLENPSFYDGWFTAKYPSLQYGVATLTPEPDAGFIGGDKIFPLFGGISSDTYSVQGNTLRSENVVSAAARAFEVLEGANCRLSLSERLLRALEAGRDAGGDKRCPMNKPALSALLMVEPPLADDTRRNSSAESLNSGASPNSVGSIKIVVPKEIGLFQGAYYLVAPYSPLEGYVDPVTVLRKRFEALGQGACQRSHIP